MQAATVVREFETNYKGHPANAREEVIRTSNKREAYNQIAEQLLKRQRAGEIVEFQVGWMDGNRMSWTETYVMDVDGVPEMPEATVVCTMNIHFVTFLPALEVVRNGS
jgi:hypothetical protein